MMSSTGASFMKAKAVAETRRFGQNLASTSPLAPPCVVSVSHMQPSTAASEHGGGRPSHLSQAAHQPPQQSQQLFPQQAAPGGVGRPTKLEAQSQDSSEVRSFLKDAGLEQYAASLLQSGFDDMETLQAIGDADMRDLGIPAVHAVRLRKKLQELQWQGASAGWEANPNHPVVLFLEEHGLGMYAKALMRSGFDDMDTLCDIEDADMKELGLPRGHALRMRKRLREYQLDQYHFANDEACMPAAHVRTPAYTPYHQVLQVRTPQHRASPPLASPPLAARPMPTEQMKTAVERSWEQVQILGTFTVGEMLHQHLFNVMPDAIQLFPTHVRTKYREWSSDEVADESNVLKSPALRKLFSKFVNAVGCAVAGLHDNTKLVPMLMQLGQRHVNYGVHEAHFEALGKAFKLTLAQILGPGFTQEVDDAWTMAYGFMSSIMLQGIRTALCARNNHAHISKLDSFSTLQPSDAMGRLADPDGLRLDAVHRLEEEKDMGGPSSLAGASATTATTAQVVDGA